MASGVMLRDPSTKKVLLDMTIPICRSLGSVDTGTANGSRSFSALAQGESFFVMVPLVNQGANGFLPVVEINGSVISWTFEYDKGAGRFSVNTRIYYGVY